MNIPLLCIAAHLISWTFHCTRLAFPERLQPVSLECQLLNHIATYYYYVHLFDTSTQFQVVKWRHFTGYRDDFTTAPLCNKSLVVSSVYCLCATGNDLLLLLSSWKIKFFVWRDIPSFRAVTLIWDNRLKFQILQTSYVCRRLTIRL